MKPLAIVAAGLLALMFFAGPAAATPGGTDKYGGHTPTEKSATKKHPAGVYHCHGTGVKRAMCDMRVRVVEQQDEINRLTVEASARAKELAEILRMNEAEKRENVRLRDKLRAANARARKAEDARKAARRDMWAAMRAEQTATRDMREAEDRARGKGPAVSSRCKDGVKATVETGRWGWGSSAKEALRKACLY